MRRVLVGLVVLVVPVAVATAGEGRALAASCDDVPAGHIRVVVVVDLGGASSTCLVVPAGTTGKQVLERRAGEIGAALPRYGSSGLLCAIDGHPAAPACGNRSAGGFAYWAYFNGSSGAWVYGNYNPFIRRLADGDIEGWRFVEGAGDGTDPPPRLAPSRALFPAIVPTTAPPPPPPPAPVAPPAPAPTTTTSVVDAAVVGPSTAAPSTPVPAIDDGTELAVEPVGATSSPTPWLPVVAVVALIGAFATGAAVRARRRA